MMRAILLLALAVPAWAQQAQTPPAEPKKEPERRPLNLRLENPSSFATVAPEKDKDKELPGLGEGARPLPKTAPGERGNPFPKDTNPTR